MVETYGYDDNSNRTSWTDFWGTGTATYDDQDRLSTYGPTSYTYSANGELLTRTAGPDTTTYGYDVLGNLRTVTLPTGVQIEYQIDAANRRIGKKVDGTLVSGFLWQSQLQPAAELDGSGNVVAEFVYATRANVPDYLVQNGTTYRIFADHLGSVRLVVDAQSGQIAQRLDYDAFGRITFDSNPGFQPFGFAGGLYDPQTGLTRFGARDYDPETGRWTAKDPIGFTGGAALLYEYIGNDPANRTDVTGLADDASPWQVGWEWLTGTGPRVHYFSDGDPFTELLRKHEHIQALIAGVESCQLASEDDFNYSLSGVAGVPKYLRDYSTLTTGGATGNLAVTYLGSYSLHYKVTGDTLDIQIFNSSTFPSATRPPVLGYTDWWKQNVAPALDSAFATGPMSPKYQIFNFQETIDRRCGCDQ